MDENATAPAFTIQNAILAARFAKRIGARLSIHGISFNEYIVMDYLFGHDDRGIARIELAEYVGMSASGVTRLVAPMEKNRLLRKESNSRDARQSLIRLTDTGRRVYVEAKDTFEEIAREMMRGIEDDRIADLVGIFDRLL